MIKVKQSKLSKAKIVLDKSKYGISNFTWNKGNNGFCFYKYYKDTLEFITFQITKKPVLTVVTDEQYKNFKNVEILALRCIV